MFVILKRMRIDFVVTGTKSTLVFRSDWWIKDSGLGEGTFVIDAVPRSLENGTWTFDHVAGYLLAGPSDEDQDAYLTNARKRADLHLSDYLRALQARAEDDDDYDFRAWIEATLARPQVLLEQAVEGETRERSIGKILVRDGRGATIDALVIDENGHAAVVNEDGHLSRFAEQWAEYAAGDRPPLNDFISWLAAQPIYGSFSVEGAGVVSASGDIQEIAMLLASDSL